MPLSLPALKELIRKEENVLFVKEGCPYCTKALARADELKRQGVIKDYLVQTLNKDFNDETLGKLVQDFGGQKHVHWGKATKPQIFMNGEYVGDSMAFDEYSG